MHAFFPFFKMFFFQQLMRRTSRQKFAFLLGNPQALVVVVIYVYVLLVFYSML